MTLTNAAASRLDTAWREFQKAAPVKLQTIRSERHYREMIAALSDAAACLAAAFI
ncbi:MAG: hypothetical protein JSS24_13105 [Proteobacteria bacterium]|nr:hypothetical protein [Pseudomonadota bacterium]